MEWKLDLVGVALFKVNGIEEDADVTRSGEAFAIGGKFEDVSLADAVFISRARALVGFVKLKDFYDVFRFSSSLVKNPRLGGSGSEYHLDYN